MTAIGTERGRILIWMRIRGYGMSLIAGVLALAGLASAPAISQEEAASAPAITFSGPIEEVVVMARRKEESLQEVPLAVTALTGAGLEDRGIDEVTELEGVVPNLTFRAGRVSEQQFAPALRGRRVESDFLSLDQAVSLYSDGVNLPRPMSVGAIMVDVGRVEVLRGPQGTLYGRNSTSGAISVYSADPTEDLAGSIQFEAGDYGLLSTLGILNIPMGPTAGLRLVANIKERDGYGENANGYELANIAESEFFRAVYRADVGDRMSMRAMFATYSGEGGGPIHRLANIDLTNDTIMPQAGCELAGIALCPLGQLAAQVEFGVPGAQERLNALLGQLAPHFPAAGGALIGATQTDVYNPGSTLAGTKPYSNGESLQFSLQIDYDLTDFILLRSITGYNESSRDAFSDVDGSPFSYLHILFDSESEFFSQELQLLGSGDNLDWVVGVFYGSEEGAEENPAVIVPQLNPLSPFNFKSDGIENETQAIFGQADWHLDWDWTLTAGARFTIDKRSTLASSALTAPGTLCAVPAVGKAWNLMDPTTWQCPRKFDDEFEDDSWILSLQRLLEGGTMIYGKVSKGYRTGGFNLRVAFDAESGQAVSPETVIEYELGLKTDLADGRVRINGALFYDEYEDMHVISVIDTAAGLPATITENAASADLLGLEGEIRVVLGSNLDLDFNFGYLDGEFNERIREDGVDLSGTPMTGVPDWTLGVGAAYNNTLSFADLLLRVDYLWRDEVDYEGFTPSNELVPGIGVRESFGRVNAKLSLDLFEWDATIAIWGQNLTDEEYVNEVIVAYDSQGLSTEIVGSPRTWGVTFTKRFGNI